MEVETLSHFHIHWSTQTKPDWEPFQKSSDATNRAQELVRPNESFRIEEFGEDCPVCPRPH
jgi:hypothetical protein